MKFKMKRITTLIFYSISKNRNKNLTTSVPAYYVIQRNDSNDIEGATRII